MPLLRRKPFIPDPPPENLTPDEEIFVCEMTGEIYREYDEFYERVILCNSLVWSCEFTGKASLTYQEALESEKELKKQLDSIPQVLQKAILLLVHHTKKGKVQDLSDAIFDFLKARYQRAETAEVKVSDGWQKAVICQGPDATNVQLASKKMKPHRTIDSLFAKKEQNKENSDGTAEEAANSPTQTKFLLDPKLSLPEADTSLYKVEILKGRETGNQLIVKGKSIRRSKPKFEKSKVKMLIKNYCVRSQSFGADGYWVVKKAAVQKFDLGISSIEPTTVIKSPSKKKKRRKSSSNDTGKEMGEQKPAVPKLTEEEKKAKEEERKAKMKERMEEARQKAKEKAAKEKEKEREKAVKEKEKEREKAKAEQEKQRMQSLEEKLKQMQERQRLKQLQAIEREMEKRKRFVEKEEEKAKKRDEIIKERQVALQAKNFEGDFLKEWNKRREDLRLEDLKPLPTFKPLKSEIPQDLAGDAIMIAEFINTFGQVFEIGQDIEDQINIDWVEKALLEHDAEGNYYQIMKFFLHTYLRHVKEETEEDEEDEEEEEEDDSNENTPTKEGDSEKKNEEEEEKSKQEKEKEAAEEGEEQKDLSNARTAAAWPMLHQGMELSDISIEPFSLTEVLRLHIMSSGVSIGGLKHQDWAEWQRRGAMTLADDPCVEFRNKEQELMNSLLMGNVYDLTPANKLKLLVLLTNQLLTLKTTRGHIEDSYDRAKELRKSLRTLQHDENARRRKLQSDKWKKKQEEKAKAKKEMEERKEKIRQEMEQRKEKIRQEKLAREQEMVKRLTAASFPAPSTNPTEQIKMENEVHENVTIIFNDQSNHVDEKAIKLKAEDDTKDGEQNAENDENGEQNGIVDAEAEAEEKRLKEERKRIKEQKEEQAEEFKQDKFRFDEKLLMDQLTKVTSMISGVPIGSDRLFRRYWAFESVDGIVVENEESETSQLVADESDEADYADADTEGEDTEPDQSADEGKPISDQPTKTFEKVSLSDIVESRNNNLTISKQLFTRYKCNFPENGDELISKAPTLADIMERVKDGVDPASYTIHERTKWYNIDSVDQFTALTNSLNTRGNRESELLASINREKKLADKCIIPEKVEESIEEVKPEKGEIDKSLFKTMNHYLEADLRDSLLEFEARIYQAGFGEAKCEDRTDWRTNLEEGISQLLKSAETKEETSADNEEPMETNAFEMVASILSNTTDIKTESDKDSVTSPLQTPSESICPAVQTLALALLSIERGIESKYLKQPLGETDETKQERIREMIEAATSKYDGKLDESVASIVEEEANKSLSTCLSRWENSLQACTSFSQVFIHLLTLERSVMWDKSVQNAKCRTCKRKGDEEKMLLCDACDRGFHMYCMKPKLKKVPQGNWFCHDCKPVEIRTPQKRGKKKVEEEEETEDSEESDEEEDEEEDDEEEEGDSDEEEDSDEAEDGTEESEDESEAESAASEHSDECTVCGSEGELILCEVCPRAYHIECVHPPIRKVPRGSWECQICTKVDLELPHGKRAATLEKKRERAALEETRPKKTQQRKSPASSQRSSSPAVNKSQPKKRAQQSSPANPKPAKKAKVLENGKSSGRQSLGFGRQDLRRCTTLLYDIFENDDSDIFVAPVDCKVVKDYAKFIDNPMDFGTIKQKLNNGEYPDKPAFIKDIKLVSTNCEIYNPPHNAIAKQGAKLKRWVNKKIKEMDQDD